MKKIWKVEIGKNFASCTVIARNIREAELKAFKIQAPIPREHYWISHIELITEAYE